MSVYLIGYDLHKGQDCTSLEDAIKGVGSTWWHCLDSTWMVVTSKTATEVRDQLLPHIRDNDKLLVILYGNAAAWYGFSGNCQSWLKDNL